MNFISIVEHLAGHLGYIGVFIMSILLPTEVLLPFIGLSISKGIYNFQMALLFTFLGELCSSVFSYGLGIWLGERIVNKFKNKNKRNKNISEKVERIFDEYGKYAILIARLIPFARTYVSILAGANKMKKRLFIKYTIVGILLTNSALLVFGYYIGANENSIWNFIHKYAISLLGIICFIIIMARLNKKRKLKRVKDNS
ncbi:DedA family protein [Clostridium sp.]|uniref:DedA family protein n=1 Tax=Clostridium sp. TaxID=1506 RepID=UPI0026DC829E|nr:DedA family protein [Clostridium sp.]MDO5039513.1 DedA family protein [Clostridium sp.]